MNKVTFDIERCKGCGLCIVSCPKKIIELSQEKTNEVFNKFKELADRKKIVSDRDIEALVGRNTIQIEEKYKLKYFAVNSASEIGATATILLEWDGGSRKFAAIGDGMVEAAFSSIDDITGIYPELQSYEISAVTGGIDAQGEVAVRLRVDDITVIGTGVSLDVIEASIRAYVNGVNKLIYEMEKRGAE